MDKSPGYHGPSPKRFEIDPAVFDEPVTADELEWLDSLGTTVVHLPPIEYPPSDTGDNTHS